MSTQITPDEFIRLGVAVLFAAIIIASLISIVGNRIHRSYSRLRGKHPLPPDTYKDHVRLVGGFTSFLFAIAVNEWIVSAAAVFIGGLLIAPERFLLVLAATLRNGKHATDIARTVMGMRPDQIVAKLDDDVDDSADDEPDDSDDNSSAAPTGGVSPAVHMPAIRRRDKVKQIEENFLTILRSRSECRLEPYSIVKEGSRRLEYDAVMIDRNTGGICAAVEVKYQQDMNATKVSHLIDKAEALLSDQYYLLFVIVFNKRNNNSVNRILNIRKERLAHRTNMGIALYGLGKNEKLEVINDDDLINL